MFLQVLIYNVNYHRSNESPSLSTVLSIGDLLLRVPSLDLSCLSNSPLFLFEPNCSFSLPKPDCFFACRCVHRCVPLRAIPRDPARTAIAYRCVLYHVTQHAPPLLIGRQMHRRLIDRHTRRRLISNNLVW